MAHDIDIVVSQEGPRRAIARLLAWKPDHFIALPPHTTLEVIEQPQPVSVPCAPTYALGLLAWQQQWLPMLDLRAFLERGAPAHERPKYALIVAWQSAPGARVLHGAFGLQVLPESVSVADSDACPLPQDDDFDWPGIAISCFRHADRPVPIVDAARLMEAPR